MVKKKKTDAHGSEIKKETWQAVIAIVFFVLALLAVLAVFDKAGFIGSYLYNISKKLLGIGYFLLPIALIMIGISFLKGVQKKFQISKLIGAILFFISGLGLIDLLFVREGGILGRYISWPLISLFDIYAAAFILITILTISILITFDIHFTLEHLMLWRLFMKKKENNSEDVYED